MIAVIEHQKVKPRKTTYGRLKGEQPLDFGLAPARLKRITSWQRSNPRQSWRSAQSNTLPSRAAGQRKSNTGKPVFVSRRKTRQPRQRSTAGGPRKKEQAAFSLPWHFSRVDLLLAAVLVLCVLVPLGFRLAPFSSTAKIPLPVIEDSEGVLADFLIPEQHKVIDSGAGQAEIIDSIKTTSYTVRRGDTISAIAQRFNISMDTVISFNGIQDARALTIGTVLLVPNADGLKYKVKRGDFLGSIAKKYRVALNDLLDWNNLETSVIVPGQELFIPGARMSEMELNRVFGRLFIYPTRGRITDRFGMRKDPFTGMRRFHNGIDLAGPVGTPVTAAMTGRVAMLGYNPTFGKYIILTHAEGYQTLYGHLDAFRVVKGERVKQGQLIADMGNTGYSTGSHLHFSIFRRGEPIDPLRYLH
jgi:murein DD-endopeptidase MepM/ murein hydrolase activator NlpD